MPFTTSLTVQIQEDNCIGCTRCVSVCPSDALHMEGRLAVLDAERCVGCMKCVEQGIPYGCIAPMPVQTPVDLGIPEAEWDQEQVAELCAEARLDPEQIVCICTGTTAGEVAAAVAAGMTEPEDIVLATGVRAICGWLCITPVTRLLAAKGVEIKRPAKDYRLYAEGVKVGIWNVPDEVADKYPEYRIKETREAIEAGEYHEPTPWFADILPAKENR